MNFFYYAAYFINEPTFEMIRSLEIKFPVSMHMYGMRAALCNKIQPRPGRGVMMIIVQIMDFQGT
jgi:hypothetical protein